jgi:hypothetical protein
MCDLNKSDIENVCKELLNAFQGVLSWKWDRRFETVLAEFGVESKENIRASLEQSLGNVWDSSNVGNAPEDVRTIDNHLGGLWPGQLLFTSDPSRDVLVFCTWWPWGDGKAISIRIGLSDNQSSDSERTEQLQSFKGWFRI